VVLDRLSFRNKFVVAFAAVVVVFAMAAVSVHFNLAAIEGATARTDISANVMRLQSQATAQMLDAAGAVHGFLLTSDPELETTYQNDRANFRETMKLLSKALESSPGAADADHMSQAGEGYFREAGDPESKLTQALAIISSGVDAKWMDEFKGATRALEMREAASLAERSKETTSAISTARSLLVAASLLAIIIASAMGFLLNKAIGAPVKALTSIMQRLARGDNKVDIPSLGRHDEIGQMAATVLTFKEAAIEKTRLAEEAAVARKRNDDGHAQTERERASAAERQEYVMDTIAEGLERLADGDLVFRIDASFPEDYEKLRVDFNGAMERLQQTLMVVSDNAAGIRSGSGEITAAADDLSRRTEQQAATLEETAAALDQITSTARKTAEGANHAREVVGAAKTDAERSGEVVRRAVETMSGIEKSSGQITQIIGVIDEIAFQTNLLALNAGVEAARAGEAGRGFAVVASEVRALAQRSAEAAKEIKALISASTAQVEQGANLVAQTGDALQRIVAQVMEINNIVGSIAASAHEQANELGQVNSAVNQMDQVTQRNAAMVEESTAASHGLAQEAEKLSQLIARFRVGETAIVAARTPVAARRAPAASKPAVRLVSRGGSARAQPASDWTEF
jgi:methyl-accepting chemotaxis protein